MQIERKYHQRAVAFMNEIKREEEERKLGMTDEEMAAEISQMEAEVQNIIQQCNEERSRKYRIVEPVRINRFQRFAEHALWLAERAEMDIRITADNLHGKISFATDFFLLNRTNPKEMTLVFVELLNTADDISIGVREGMLTMEFFFDLYVDVDRE